MWCSPFQGAYIAPVLKEENMGVLNDGSEVGYLSFGSTDNMGRQSPQSTNSSSSSSSPTIGEKKSHDAVVPKQSCHGSEIDLSNSEGTLTT